MKAREIVGVVNSGRPSAMAVAAIIKSAIRRRGLRERRPHHATVLISHRLNTVRDADLILVLADGVIGERGRHETLMASSGIYARPFSLQAKGYTAQEAESV